MDFTVVLEPEAPSWLGPDSAFHRSREDENEILGRREARGLPVAAAQGDDAQPRFHGSSEPQARFPGKPRASGTCGSFSFLELVLPTPRRVCPTPSPLPTALQLCPWAVRACSSLTSLWNLEPEEAAEADSFDPLT